jgi:excisionase family DNA binding protein
MMRSPVRFSIALSGVPAPREEPRLLSPQQVAERCNLSYGGVVAAINRGELRAARLGRRLRIPADAVDEWVESQMVQPRRAASRLGSLPEPAPAVRSDAGSPDRLAALEREAA